MSDAIIVSGNEVIVKMLQEEYPDPIENFYVYGTSDTTWANTNLHLSWNAKMITGFVGYILRLYDYIGGVAGDLRREIETTQTEYDYTYSQNIEDTDIGDFPQGSILARLYTKNSIGELSNLTEKVFTNTNPGNITGLYTSSTVNGVSFYWTANLESDLAGYYVQVVVNEDDYVPDWGSITYALTTGTELVRLLTTEEIATYTNPKVFFRIRAVDVFGNVSGSVSTSRVPGSFAVEPTDIADFSLTASKMFLKIPILESDAWQDNTPSSGYVSWNSHKLYYSGAEYQISAGATDKKYIYWISGNTYLSSDDLPSLSDNEFVIATNIDGYHDMAWNAIANEVIGSAYIAKASIASVHIQNAAISDAHISGKLTVGVTEADVTAVSELGLLVDSWRFDATTINGAKIKTGSLYLNYIYVQGGPPANADNTSASYIGTIVNGWRYGSSTEINGNLIRTGTIRSESIISMAYDKVYNGPPINADNTNNAIGSTTIGQRVLGWGHANNATLIDGGDIYTGSVYANQLASNSVTSAKIEAGAVIAGKLATNSIVAGNIQAGAVTTDKINANQIVTNHIQANNITYPVIVTASSVYVGSSDVWTNILVGTITTIGGPVEIGISGGLGALLSGSGYWKYRLLRYGGATLIERTIVNVLASGIAFPQGFCDFYIETPSSGYYAYVLQAWKNGNAYPYIDKPVLKMIEFRR